MHTLKVVVVDPSASHEKVTFERVRQGAVRLLPHLPAFRRRPVAAPLGSATRSGSRPPASTRPPPAPRGASPRSPGGGPRRAARPDRERAARRVAPALAARLRRGSPGGRIAYVVKLHHALADGLASAELALRLFQPTPEPAALPPAYEAEDEPVPPALLRLGRSLRRELGRQREVPPCCGARCARSASPVAGARRGTRPAARLRLAAHPLQPRTHAQPELRARDAPAAGAPAREGGLRVHAERRLPRARRGLAARLPRTAGELPERALTAAVPVSVRREGEDPAFGNATAYWFATTGTDLADPAERLVAVAASTRAARALFQACDPRLAVEWLDHWRSAGPTSTGSRSW